MSLSARPLARRQHAAMRVMRKQKHERAKSGVPHVHVYTNCNPPGSLGSGVAGACVGNGRENASMYTKDHVRVGESSNATRNEADLALSFACDIKSELKRDCKVGSWALNNEKCHQGMHNGMSAR